MGPNLTAIERAAAAASEYAAAWGDTVRSFEQGEGYELAAAHMRRAGGQLVALVEGLMTLHDELDRPPVLSSIGRYGPDEVLRIVRAAVAFRRAAPVHKWPYQAWHEMAEICAAVDCKPGPDEVTARAMPVQPTIAGPERNAGDATVHAAIVHPLGLYHAMCGAGELDERHTAYARTVPAGQRCGRFGCREAFDGADQAVQG